MVNVQFVCEYNASTVFSDYSLFTLKKCSERLTVFLRVYSEVMLFISSIV